MRLLLVEDSRLLRERLRGMIRAVPGCEIVAEADTEADARLRVDQLRPDVIVLDLRLRGGSGLSVLDYVKARQPDVIVIVLTNYGDAEYRARCLDLGADYFFDKSRDIDTFLGVLAELQLRLFDAAGDDAGMVGTAADAAGKRGAT
ncbi:response regulator transcription factor [uncultured Propionivibrio sp.]|uniref:response regulator transcription factor n=1 Tax=uncultured Propionivibrio sp. TaxID=426737 RepID=UPI0029BFC42E|nr:response regulator transcription factor [uncultured Propionivibrio sp.]